MQRINLKCRLKLEMHIQRMFFQLPIFHSATAWREKGAIASDLLRVKTTAPQTAEGFHQRGRRALLKMGQISVDAQGACQGLLIHLSPL